MAAGELNLRDYWLILRKRRWFAIAALLGVLVTTHLYTNAQTPIYAASTNVRIVERKATVSLLEILMGTVGDPMLSQTKVVQSQAVMELAARNLGWLQPDAPQQTVLDVAMKLRGMLDISVLQSTDVIRISVESTDPAQAARIANTVAEAYREVNLLDKNSQARSLREFTEQQLKNVEAKLHALEGQLAALTVPAVGIGEGEEGKGNTLAIAAELEQLQAERDKLLRQFTELHPNVRALDERIAALRSQVTTTTSASPAHAVAASANDASVRLTALKRERELTEQSYRTLKAKYEEARLAEAEKVSDVTIVNPAVVPTAPVRPNRRLNYLLGLLVGATLGLMAAFVIEHLDASIGTIEDVEQYLQLPVLGIIPFLTPLKSKLPHTSWVIELKQFLMPQKPHKTAMSRLREQTLIHYPPNSAIADAFRLLRTNMRVEVFNNDLHHKLLMITSAGNDEGKTIITCNLAIAFAQEGRRILLVDADLRRPSIHHCLGFRKREPGLSNILTDACAPEQAVQTFVELMMGDIGFDTAIQTPGLDNLAVITAGSAVYSPPDLLESKALDRFFQWAREHYDIVLVDAAPVLAVADPLLIAPKAEAVVLVYKVGKTARKAIQRAKFQLEGIKATVKGVVMNNISPEVELGTNYYYRQYRYAYDKESKSEPASL